MSRFVVTLEPFVIAGLDHLPCKGTGSPSGSMLIGGSVSLLGGF